MQATIRRKLSMAGQVLRFERSYPSSDESHTTVVAKLDELLSRANELATRELLARAGESAALERRRFIRRELHPRLKALVAVADTAARDERKLTGAFKIPHPYGPNRVVLDTARGLLSLGRGNATELAAAGLPATLLDEIEAAIAAFEAEGVEANAARAEHVDARAQLESLSGEVSEVIDLLDRLNKVRFEKDPFRLETWRSARNVFGPVTKSQGTATDAAQPEDRQIPPTTGEDTKAA